MWSGKESNRPPKPQPSTSNIFKAKQQLISEEAASSLASPPSSPTGSSDPDDSLPLQLPPLHHQQTTSGSIQLSVLKNFHLKII
jgi:hypothetical protein